MAGGGSSKSHLHRKSSAEHLAERNGGSMPPVAVGIVRKPDGSYGRVILHGQDLLDQLGDWVCSVKIGAHHVAGHVATPDGGSLHPMEQDSRKWVGAYFVKL